MPSCQYCGAGLPQDARFCVSCGRPTSSGIGTAADFAVAKSPSRTSGNGALFSTREFIMTKKILSIREHYDFTSRGGMKLGEGDGNFFRLPAKFVVLDSNNSEIMHLNGRLLSIRREFDMFDPSGNLIGVMKKKLIKLIGSEYWVEREGAEYARVFGNFLEHDYQMESGRAQVAQVHRNWSL